MRVIRDNVVVHEGKLSTLKRFKDEVAVVQAGQECGMAFENIRTCARATSSSATASRKSAARCKARGGESGDARSVGAAAEGFDRRSFTVDEILAVRKPGIISEEENFELIEGEIVPMQAKTHVHELLKSALNLAIARPLPERLWLGVEITSI